MLGQILLSRLQDMEIPEEPLETLSLIELLFKGGYMMIPIVILSLMSIYIFAERVVTINKAAKTPDGFIEQIKQLVLNGDISAAKLLCGQTATPIARMIEKGVARIGNPLKNIEVSIENVGKIEIYKLEKNLSLLASISGAAPMIGFLGTVTGMIQAFISIAQEEGVVSPKLLSSGIYEAMITTAAGLFVGILAYLGYNFLIARVDKVVHTMEHTSIDFIDLLQEPPIKMNLKSKHKVSAAFNMSSMTDVIFLLLIFFMLTASFVTPSGLPVNLPTSKSSKIILQKVSVTITKGKKFYVNDKKVNANKLEMVLRNELMNKEGVVVLHCDKDVPVEDLVYVAGIATKLEAKVSIATKPD